jgi:hypothetical protein
VDIVGGDDQHVARRQRPAVHQALRRRARRPLCILGIGGLGNTAYEGRHKENCTRCTIRTRRQREHVEPVIGGNAPSVWRASRGGAGPSSVLASVGRAIVAAAVRFAAGVEKDAIELAPPRARTGRTVVPMPAWTFSRARRPRRWGAQ